MHGSKVEPALPQRNHGAKSRDSTETPEQRHRPHYDDTATRSRVTRVDASSRVNEHDQNVDTLLGSASGTERE